MFYPEILERYKQILKDGTTDSYIHFTTNEHLLWMISELENNKTQSLTKKHRWLGFIQGILCVQEMTDVMTERDLTRDIFNGD